MEAQYQPLRESSSSDSLAGELYEKKFNGSSRKTQLLSTRAPWIVSTIFFALLSLFLAVVAFRDPHSYTNAPTYCPSTTTQSASTTDSYPHDFADAVAAIQLESREFTGKIQYNSNNESLYMTKDENEPQYVGDPAVTPGIDKAWDDLLKREFFTLTEDEVASLLPDIRPVEQVEGQNRYYAELAVFHGLHCVNKLRMQADRKYYQEKGDMLKDEDEDPLGWRRIHFDHCVEYLRQSIQCAGDLTIVPLYMQDFEIRGVGLALGQDRTHTCRNFASLRQWLDKRAEARPSWDKYGKHFPHSERE